MSCSIYPFHETEIRGNRAVVCSGEQMGKLLECSVLNKGLVAGFSPILGKQDIPNKQMKIRQRNSAMCYVLC